MQMGRVGTSVLLRVSAKYYSAQWGQEFINRTEKTFYTHYQLTLTTFHKREIFRIQKFK